MAETMPDDNRCTSYAFMGPRCDLEAGHDGGRQNRDAVHKHVYDTGRVFSWTDRGQDDVCERSGGTRGT